MFITAFPAFASTFDCVPAAVCKQIEHKAEYAAQLEGWDVEKITVAHRPSVAANGFACNSPLSVQLQRRSGVPLGKIRASIKCNSPIWEMRSQFDISMVVNMWVPARNFSSGQWLTESSLQQKAINIERYRRFVFSKNELVGAQVKRRISTNEPILYGQVTSPFAVRDGDKVQVTSTVDGVTVSGYGVALENATVGERISVSNVSSGIIVSAKVVEVGKTEVYSD